MRGLTFSRLSHGRGRICLMSPVLWTTKKKSRERELAKIKELEAQPPLLVPPVPDAKSIESERRVAKMLKELGEERERKKSRPVPVPEVEPPALYSRDLAGNLRLNIGIESVET